MKKSTSALMGLAAAFATVIPLDASAVDYGPKVTRIWGGGGGGIGRGIGRIDIDDVTPGQETFIPAYLESTYDPDGAGGNGDVRAEVKVKMAIRDKNGGWIATLDSMLVRSMPYPDPCVSDNQAGNINAVYYNNNWLNVQAYPGQSCQDNRDTVAEFFASQGMLNTAIGTSSAERTLLFGLSVDGDYWSPTSEDEVSVFKFYSYDADTHDRLCQLYFLGLDENDRELEPAFSGVGPYLDASTDVLRVAYAKDGATEGQIKWRHQYYDIRTCGLIQTQWATSPTP